MVFFGRHPRFEREIRRSGGSYIVTIPKAIMEQNEGASVALWEYNDYHNDSVVTLIKKKDRSL